MYLCDFAGEGGGGNTALKKENRFMRFQTNIGYANSKTWDVICI